MAKENWFASVVMSYNIVGTYYPPNNNYPDFDRFVFQPMIDDGTQADDVYTLIAYAVDVDGNVLASFPSLTVLTPRVLKSKKTVNFANLKMDLADLAALYPTGGNSAITMVPKGFYNGGNYIYYIATTDNGELASGSTQINPSPPA
jgi:hypothetical protein